MPLKGGVTSDAKYYPSTRDLLKPPGGGGGGGEGSYSNSSYRSEGLTENFDWVSIGSL
jgi:hypothetical protein